VKALNRIGRRRNKHTSDEEQPVFAVDSCACFVEGEVALLRLTGTGIAPPVTLVTEADASQTFAPLPQPDAELPSGAWRAGFAVPADLVEPGTRLWLLDGGQFMTDIRVPVTDPPPAPPAPEPVAGPEPEAVLEPVAVAHQPSAEDVDPGDDARARKLVEAWSEAAALREKLADREQDLAENLAELLQARNEVEPLRERALVVASELASAREELETSHKQGREARLRASEKTAELEALQAELASVEPRITEATESAARAEQEAATLRAQVAQLEAELAAARAQAESTAEQARGEHERLATEAAERQRTADELQSELEELKEQPKSRRRGLGRRSEDRKSESLRNELEARIAEQQERIEQLEGEALSFAERRDEAVSASLRERVAELEEELRQHGATGEDLRALLESEREQVAGARAEVRDLRIQLATATAKRVSEVPSPEVAPVAVPDAEPVPRKRAPVEPPPWSALDDELLARIEKAKALTTG
jgi:chromosome segregation ATPase